MNKEALLVLYIMPDIPPEILDFHFVGFPAILSPLLLPQRRLRPAREETEFHFNGINWILEVAGGEGFWEGFDFSPGWDVGGKISLRQHSTRF